MVVAPLGDRLVKITLGGRLDTPGVDRVENRFVAQLVPAANNAVVDLSQVDFIASMGLRMLISAAKALQNRQARLVLFGAQSAVQQVFDAVDLGKIISICSSESEALAAIGLSVR